MNNEELLADIDSTLHGAPTYLYELLTRCQMVLKEQAELIAAAPAQPGSAKGGE